MTKYICVNRSFGERCPYIKETYNNPQEFLNHVKELKKGGKLRDANPVLVEVDLHKGETVVVHQNDGWETIEFRKTSPLKSKKIREFKYEAQPVRV